MIKYIIFAIVTLLGLPLHADGQSSFDGSYFSGDGYISKHLYLDTDGTFFFHMAGCTGTYMYQTGKWNHQDDFVVLHATRKPKESLDLIEQTYPAYYALVEWSDRFYLIRKNRIIDFINRINDGREPRHNGLGFFLLRDGDSEKPVTGRPRLHHKYSKYFMDQPVRAKVIEKTNDRLFRIDAGQNQGLVPGIVLHAQDGLYDTLEVVSIESDSAPCASSYGDDPPIGKIFSTLRLDE